MIKIIIYLLLLSSTVYSCSDSNAIYYDLKTQTIISCNNKGIRQLYINNDFKSEVYLIRWSDSLKPAPNNVILTNIDNHYQGFSGWNNKLFSLKDFKLKPSSQYTIERAQGDAAGYKIKVWTNELGIINKVVQKNCNE